MTETELLQIEAHFRNPPSASQNAELALRLVAEVRRLKAAAAPAPLISEASKPVTLPVEPPEESRPTPPARPVIKKGR